MKPDAESIVGVLLKGYPRLSETFILNEILLLEKLGFKLHLFALRNPGEAKVHESVRQVRAPVTYIPDYFWPFFWAFVKANVKLWWRKPGVYWSAFRFAAWRSLRQWSSSTIKRFVQAAYMVENHMGARGKGQGESEKNRVQLAHIYAHFSHGPTTVAYFVARLTGLKYSFSAHAKDIYVQEHDFLREKILQARFVTTCTDYNKNYLEKIGGPEAHVFRTYHGLDLDRFPGPERAAKNACPRILSVGRFVPKKGFPVLIRALHVLRERGYKFQCHLIGGGEMEIELKSLIKKLKMEDRLTLHGAMSQDELFGYYRRADIFALACEVQSDGDRDGIPNVIVEAMALGIPVVSTRISGIPECVEDGVSGVLVAEKDPVACANGIAALLDRPEWAKQLGQAGRAKVEKDFDALRNVKKIGAALRQAMGEAETVRPSRYNVEPANSAAKASRYEVAEEHLESSH
jgi:glycosyltransferase involved in cell wall biosynthesis